MANTRRLEEVKEKLWGGVDDHMVNIADKMRRNALKFNTELQQLDRKTKDSVSALDGNFRCVQRRLGSSSKGSSKAPTALGLTICVRAVFSQGAYSATSGSIRTVSGLNEHCDARPAGADRRPSRRVSKVGAKAGRRG